MNATDRQRLQNEFDEISKRIADTKDDGQKEFLKAQFGERLAHIQSRLEEAMPNAEKPAKK